MADRLDPLQFAYKPRRGVEDASLTLTNLIAAHLENPANYVRILFMDFSSAFNTTQPHILINRLGGESFHRSLDQTVFKRSATACHFEWYYVK